MTIMFNSSHAKKIFRAVSLFSFLAGCMFYTSARQGTIQWARTETGKHAVITAQEMSVNSQGKKRTKALIVSELKPGGGWVSTRYSVHSPKWSQATASEYGQDIVSSDGRTIHKEGVAPGAETRKKMSTVEFYKNHPKYSGEDTILGYQAFKLKYDMPNGGWREMTYAPQIGAFHLRFVLHNPGGGEVIQQAVKIEFK